MRGARGGLTRACGRLAAVAALIGAGGFCGRATAQDGVKKERAGASAERTKTEEMKADGSPERGVIRASRGTAGTIEVEYAVGGLRAKAAEPNAPVLVRVGASARAGFFTIEYLGLRTGEFDLASLVERVDGRAAGLAPIPIRFESRLPADAGTDVFGQGSEELDLRVWYREGLIALGAAWLLVPVVVMVRRRLARMPMAQGVAAAPESTAMERLRAIVAEAGGRELSVEERARMELLLLRAMREAAGNGAGGSGAGRVEGAPGGAREIAAALASLRRGEATGAIVRAVEAWTHAEGGLSRGGSRERAVAAAGRVARASEQEVAAASGTPGRVGGGA